MLVLGIYGSPRKAGNTDLMMDAFLDGATSAGAEVKRLYVRDMELQGCMECGHCDKEGSCIIKDDMVEVYPLFEEATRIVVASPIFFYGVTGQLKLLIDRSQAFYMRRELARKEGKEAFAGADRRGFFLSAGATRGKRMFECAILTMKYFYDALSVAYAGELCYGQIEEKGAILDRLGAIDACRSAGGALAG